jgi:hypothetical protein
MTRDIFAGQIRELANAAGAALVAFGFLEEQFSISISGLAVSLAMLAWGLRNKSGAEAVLSGLRKVIGAAGGVVLVLGYLEAAEVESLLAVAATILSLVGSFFANGGKPSGRLPVVLLLGVLALLLSSCGGSFRYDLGPDWGGAVIGIDIPAQK